LIKFSPKFIRRRYREVPTGALMELQKRRVWSVFAKLTRRSRQVSGKVLTKEINAVYSGSSSSFLHRLRDLEYKKADFLKVYIRKARLPYYHQKNKRRRRRRRTFRRLRYYGQFIERRFKRFKYFKKLRESTRYIPRLSREELFICRINLYYTRRSQPKGVWRIRKGLKKIKKNLFSSRSSKKLLNFMCIARKLNE